MPRPFQPRLEILPPAQRAIWPDLQQIPSDFVLYGGTALALRLGHRHSIDFDFFALRGINPDLLLADLALLRGAQTLQKGKNTLTVIVDRGGPVKMSFFGVPRLRMLRPPEQAPDNGVRVASLLDLAGTKASVVQVRAEAKDYIDLDAILKETGMDLLTALAAAREIYGSSFNPQITLKALSFFDDGNLREVPAEVQERLAAAARTADLDSLPDLKSTQES